MAGLTACGRHQDEVSALRHDMDQPVRVSEAYNWIDATDAEYAQQVLGVDADAILPADDPLTVRAQYWLDQVDTMLRTRHPDELANVPKPKAAIIRSSTVNAFVAPAAVCYKLPVSLSSDESGDTIKGVVIDPQTGGIEAWPSSQTCIKRAPQAGKLKAFVDAFNERSPDCQLAVKDENQVSIGEGCHLADELGRLAC